ncbi:hypothetical protein CGZ69_34675 [Streptomyces peucetius subsp. caesius ATCC 27952]|nr:hypothetical protein CGZ69_34675 [Streptomyces peucetius subsp. caesius ATCC 27952]
MERLAVDALDGTAPGPGTGLVDLRDTRDAFVSGSCAPHGTDVHLRVSGARSRDIAPADNELTRAAAAVETTGGAAPDTVIGGSGAR